PGEPPAGGRVRRRAQGPAALPGPRGSQVVVTEGSPRGPGGSLPDARDVGRRSSRRAVVSGSSFEEEVGYARAVVDGDWVHVSGTTGFDYATMTIVDDVAEQTRQALPNIAAALDEAGAPLPHAGGGPSPS